MSAESPLMVAVAKIAQQVAMRTLDFMLLTLLDTACHRTDRLSIGSSKHEVGPTHAQAVSRAHPPRIDARSGAKQEQEVVRNCVAEKSSIQVCGPSHGQTRRAPANSSAVTGGGAPWRRIPGRSPLQLATSARPLATVLAAARGSTRCAGPQPLPTPSASAPSFLVCCKQRGWQARPRPSASQGSPSLEPIALHVHASRIAFALRRTGHTRGECQRCRNCAPGMGHYSGSCTGRKPPHRGPKYLSWPDGLQLPLSRLRHEPLGFPDARPSQSSRIPRAGKFPETVQRKDQDPGPLSGASPSDHPVSN